MFGLMLDFMLDNGRHGAALGRGIHVVVAIGAGTGQGHEKIAGTHLPGIDDDARNRPGRPPIKGADAPGDQRQVHTAHHAATPSRACRATRQSLNARRRVPTI